MRDLACPGAERGGRGSEQRTGREGGVGWSLKSAPEAGRQGRTPDRPAQARAAFLPSPQRLPGPGILRAGFFRRGRRRGRRCRAGCQPRTCPGAVSKSGPALPAAPRDHALGRPVGAAPGQKAFRGAGPPRCVREAAQRAPKWFPRGPCRETQRPPGARSAGVCRLEPGLRCALCAWSFGRRRWHRGKGTPCAHASERRRMLLQAWCERPKLQPQTSPPLRGHRVWNGFSVRPDRPAAGLLHVQTQASRANRAPP